MVIREMSREECLRVLAGATLAKGGWLGLLTQVTQLRAIADFFAGEIARKSLRDGGGFVGRRCSEDLLS